MGSWNGTCLLSNVPILAGEKVKAILIAKINNIKYRIITMPIDGTYNDYGCIENIEETEYTQYLLEYFNDLLDNKKIIALDGDHDNKKILQFRSLEKVFQTAERDNLRINHEIEEDFLKTKTMMEKSCLENGSEYRYPSTSLIEIRLMIEPLYNIILKDAQPHFKDYFKFKKNNSDYINFAEEITSPIYNFTAVKEKFFDLTIETLIFNEVRESLRKPWEIIGAGSQEAPWDLYITLYSAVLEYTQKQKIEDF
jgi:hypothetical protein